MQKRTYTQQTNTFCLHPYMEIVPVVDPAYLIGPTIDFHNSLQLWTSLPTDIEDLEWKLIRAEEVSYVC